MTTKEYLSQITRLDQMIQNKLSEIFQLKTIACNVTVSNDTERVQKTSDKDKLGSAVAKIVDLENETNELVDNFVNKRKRIIEQIDGMQNNDYYNILSLRYVKRNTFEEISDYTHWSIRTVFSIHGRALQEFEKLYGQEYL